MQRVCAPRARRSFPWHQHDCLGSMGVFTTDTLAGMAMIYRMTTELYTTCTLNNDDETASVRQPSSYRSGGPQVQNQKAASNSHRTGPNQHGVCLLAGHVGNVKHVARMKFEPSPTTSSLKVPPLRPLCTRSLSHERSPCLLCSDRFAFQPRHTTGIPQNTI
jgi:hypothetical protein